MSEITKIKRIYGAHLKAKDEDFEPQVIKHKKLPFHIIEEALLLFRMVYADQQTEVGVFITLNDDGIFDLVIPDQDVSAGHIAWENDGSYGDIVGSIHSHCNMGAFFSGTDLEDNRRNPGLHLVIGKIMGKPEFGVEFTLSPEDVRKPSMGDVVKDFDELKDNLVMPDYIDTDTMNRITKSYGTGYKYKGNRGWL